MGIENRVLFVGPVYGRQKENLLAAAELFVLPSFSENFGIVIPEALASGVPVITTKGTPWDDMVRCNCGWWIDLGVEPLVAALRQGLEMSDTERREMGMRGRRLVEEEYTWPSVARQMLAVYAWLRGEGERPGSIWES